MRDAISECERAVQSGGLAAGLTLALDGADDRAAPGSVAALPARLVPAGAPLIRHEAAAAEGISFVRAPARRAITDDELTALGARLGAARLAVTSQLLDRAVQHLSGRTAAGEPVIRKQLVAGALSDAQVVIETARRCLRVAAHLPVAVADVHGRITETDWELAKLLGASGYAGPGTARRAFVSRLIANCWVRQQEAA